MSIDGAFEQKPYGAMSEYLEEQKLRTWSKVDIYATYNLESNGSSQPPEVSVLVPVMNVEDYLQECLDSIQAQEFDSFEVICVNDGSTDDSLKILRAFAEKDSRFKVIDKANAGYGHALNIALDQARGRYVMIVESDDTIRPGMMATLYAAATNHDLDMVKSDYYRFTTDEYATRLFYHSIGADSGMYNRVTRALDDERFFKFSNTWCGMYRRAWLEEFVIRHQETPGASYQDNGFWFQTTCAARKMMYLETPFYMNRRDRAGSSVFNNKKLYAGNSEFLFIESFLERHPKLKEQFNGYLIKKKFDTYRYNAVRVAAELKQEYVQHCAKEFARDFADGRVEKQLFSEGDFKKLTRWATDPESIYEEVKSSALGTFTGENDPDEIPLCFITDNNYAMPAAVALTSLSKNRAKGSNYYISIVCLNVNDVNIKKLSSLSERGMRIEILQLNPDKMKVFEGKSLTNFGVPSTALVKFLLPSLLHNVKKVLYIDDDVLILSDLKELYEQDLRGYTVGAVADIPQVLYEKRVIGVKYGSDYFNSGVLLLDLEKMRKAGDQDRLIALKSHLESNLQDQDVFNELYLQNKNMLPIKYNTLLVNLHRSSHKFKLEQINSRFGTNYKGLEGIRRDAVILHFCSPDKPWKYYDVPMADAWLYYFANSPYSEIAIYRTSNLNKPKEVVTNGYYNTLAVPTRAINVSVIVRKASIASVRTVVKNLDFFAKQGADLHVLHSSLSEADVERLLSYQTDSVRVHAYDISKAMKRDSGYVQHPRSASDRLLIAEILYHLERILFLDNATIQGDPAEVLSYLSEAKEFGVWPLADGATRLLDVGAILLNPFTFIASGVKQRYHENLRNQPSRTRSPSAAASYATSTLRELVLQDPTIDTTRHNQDVLASDLKKMITRLKQTETQAIHLETISRFLKTAVQESETSYAKGVSDGKLLMRNSRTYQVGDSLVRVPRFILRNLRKRRAK